MKCPDCCTHPIMRPYGIGKLVECPVYHILGDPEIGEFVLSSDVLSRNPGHDEDDDEWAEQDLKELYSGVW